MMITNEEAASLAAAYKTHKITLKGGGSWGGKNGLS